MSEIHKIRFTSCEDSVPQRVEEDSRLFIIIWQGDPEVAYHVDGSKFNLGYGRHVTAEAWAEWEEVAPQPPGSES